MIAQMLSRVKKERKAQIEKITREVFPSLKPYRFRLGKAYFFAKIFVPYLTTAYGQPDKSLISCGFTRLDLFTSTCFCLSWCVHPTDAYAQEYENGQLGKTEMWYVLEAEPGASLYYGFTHEISKEEFERRIQDNTLTDVLNAVPVHKGDCFFIPSGTLHAIRKGIVVAEIQQNSNVTYRIYDYGRLGADGKPRQLHIPQALDVTLREPPKAQDFHGHLAQCDYFTVDAVEGGFEDVCDETSFTSLLVLEGKGTLTETATGESLPIRKGQSLFLPAGTGAYAVTGTDLKCLRTRV